MKNSSAKTLQSSLCSANFILLVLGQGISLFGNTMLRFAMSMWVLDETASSTTFATVLAISVIPTILISPFGGVMADRVSKRAMMVALDIISGIVTLLATVFFALSGFNILAIAIMQIVLAVLDAMETPVVQSALPQIIGRESSTDLRRGAAIINQVQQLSQLLPSFLGGVMYGLVGIRPMCSSPQHVFCRQPWLNASSDSQSPYRIKMMPASACSTSSLAICIRRPLSCFERSRP